MDVAVGVRDGYVELLVRGEEGGCYDFDGVGRFAEETQLVGVLLFTNGSVLPLHVTTVSEV